MLIILEPIITGSGSPDPNTVDDPILTIFNLGHKYFSIQAGHAITCLPASTIPSIIAKRRSSPLELSFDLVWSGFSGNFKVKKFRLGTDGRDSL